MDAEAKIRDDVRNAAAIAMGTNGRSETSADLLLRRCCYLSRGTVRECFDDFTEVECKRAADSCGCTFQFVLAGKCP